MTSDAGLAAELDWSEVACQCAHHAADGCTANATRVIAIHALHRCNEPGLDEDGNRVEIRCFSCVQQLWIEIHAKLEPLNRHGRAHCGTCGAPITQVSDVLRSVEVFR